MLRLPHRAWLAAAVAGIGTGVALFLAGLPPGELHHRPLAPFHAVASRPGIACMLLAFVAWTLGLLLATAWVRAGRELSLARAVSVVEPVALGASSGALALLLEPWWFESPALVLLGGGIGWGAILGWRRLEELPPPVDRRDATRRTVTGLALLAVALPTLLVAPGPPRWHELSGDEPHYLVIARSLWVDGDVELGDEYRPEFHASFFPSTLLPHAMPGHRPGTRYSIHGTGLGVWLAPWYGLGRGLSTEAFTFLVRFAMILWLGAAAVILHRLIDALTGGRAGARGAALAVVTAPLLFAGPHLFPEVPALVLSGGAWLLLRRRPGPGGALTAGILLAALPWLGYKFAGVAAALGLAGAWLLLRPGSPDRGREERRRRGDRAAAVAALLTPLLVSAAGHVAFTWTLYRSIWPTAITAGAGNAERVAIFGQDAGTLAGPLAMAQAGLGYLMDQREGLLAYAPHYLLAVAGLAWMLRRRRIDFIVMTVTLGALWVPYAVTGAIGGWSPPARPLTGVLWTLAAPLGVALALHAGDGPTGRLRAAVRGGLVTAAAGITGLLAVQPDLLYHDHNTALSLLLRRYGAPGLPLWSWAPSWLAYDEPRWTVTLAWLAVIVGVGAWLARWGWEAAGHRAQGMKCVVGPAAATGARVVLLAGAGALLLHHALVPMTALHRASTYDGVRIWEPLSPPQRVWPDPRGVWIGGFDAAELRLSSAEQVSSVTFRVRAAGAMRARLGVGNDHRSLDLGAGEETLVRLSPGPGSGWGEETFWPLWVRTPGGASPLALGTSDDGRMLGLRLELVEVRRGRPGGRRSRPAR